MAKHKKDTILLSEALQISKRFASSSALLKKRKNDPRLCEVFRCLVHNRIAHEDWCYAPCSSYLQQHQRFREAIAQAIQVKQEFLQDDGAKHQVRLFFKMHRKEAFLLRRWNLLYGPNEFVKVGGPNRFSKRGEYRRTAKFRNQEISEEVLERARALASQNKHLSRLEFKRLSAKDYSILYRANELDDYFVLRLPRAHLPPLIKEKVQAEAPKLNLANMFATIDTRVFIKKTKGKIYTVKDHMTVHQDKLMKELKNLESIYGKKIPSEQICRMCRIQNFGYPYTTKLLKKMGAKPFREQGFAGLKGRYWIMP